MGYSRADFDEIVGVDIKPQPRYPFEFVQADAMTYPLEGFDAIHASPPCQAHSALGVIWPDRQHADLLTPTLARLDAVSVPWVVENVGGAPMRAAIQLCGTSFALGTADKSLRRHRLFEIGGFVMLAPPCAHNRRRGSVEVYGHAGGTSHRDGRPRSSSAERAEAMGIDWMTGDELSQAIPPAFTEYIGRALIAAIREGRLSRATGR